MKKSTSLVKLTIMPVEIIISIIAIEINHYKDCDEIFADIKVGKFLRTLEFTTKPNKGKDFVEELFHKNFVWDSK
jgi:hypothetical protein